MAIPPEPFQQLSDLAEDPETIEQAALLSDALRTIPDLQRWLRERRQHIVRTLHDRDGMTYTDMAPHLGVKPERVSGIARGHSRSPRKKAASDDGKPPSAVISSAGASSQDNRVDNSRRKCTTDNGTPV